eukprot:m.101090 g.101090  ORF g.101090 m.101090 type:complete len:254 (-) comp13192_c1_seq1:3119-3880(-)
MCASPARGAIRRFYREVSVVASATKEGWFNVLLDNRPIKTPKKVLFEVPSEPIAYAVACEWDSQPEVINPSTILVGAICNAALDNPTNLPQEARLQNLLPFLETDTVAFRASFPDQLIDCESKAWDPLVDWFKQTFNVPLYTTTALHIKQAQEAKDAYLNFLRGLNQFELTAMELAVDTTKSAVIPAALYHQQISATEAVNAARVEVAFQTERFGEVEWHHTIEKHDTTRRVASAAFIMHESKDCTMLPLQDI